MNIQVATVLLVLDFVALRPSSNKCHPPSTTSMSCAARLPAITKADPMTKKKMDLQFITIPLSLSASSKQHMRPSMQP